MVEGLTISEDLNEYYDIFRKITSSEIRTMEQMSIYCTLLGINDEDTFRFIMTNAFEPVVDDPEISRYALYRFVFNVFKKSGHFDRCITNDFITKAIENNGSIMLGENSAFVRMHTVSDMLKMDTRNPIILLRYFLSFEDQDNITRLIMKKNMNMQDFFTLFHCIITRCTMRAGKMDKLKPIEKRLRNVISNMNSMNSVIQ